MKLRSYLLIFIAAFAGTLFLASCLNEENKIPDNCYDGVLNNGENPEGYIDVTTDKPFLDCGGTNCDPCDHCANGVYEPWLGEDWTDCGGECGACPQCANGIMDGDEVAIDCGGSCGGCEQLCEDGLLNGFEDQIDCEDVTDTEQGGCDFCPTCIDGVMNGDETGIDCGGPDCQPCCSTGNCTNAIADGNEFNVNCGGSTCPDCPDTLTWKIGNINYYSPRVTWTVGNTGGLTFTMCPAFELNEAPFQLGSISIVITQPGTGWASAIGQQIQFPPFDQTLYSIEFTDDATGTLYSSSNAGGSGKITMAKVASVVVPASTTDGCNKPAGTYDYYRGVFQGTLTSVAGEQKSLTSGYFQYTKYTP